jgi:hypothetical protein
MRTEKLNKESVKVLD